MRRSEAFTLGSLPLIFLLSFSVLISPVRAIDQGWGGRLSNGEAEIDKYLQLMSDDGWTAIRLYGSPPWMGGPTYTLTELDHAVTRASELGIRIYLDLAHTFPPSDYLSGHVQELIDYETMIGLRYNNATNVVIEVVNEWLPPTSQEGYATYQSIVSALREAGVDLPLLLNYHSQWMSLSNLIDDPLNRTMYGKHYYGNYYDDLGQDAKFPLDLDTFANESGITASLQDLFINGDIGTVLAQNKCFAVTELGCSYDYSDQWVQGGYDMDPGGVAYVLKFIEYAEKYGVTVIGHRIGDSYQCDYPAYKQLAMEYFGVELDPAPAVAVTSQNNPVLFILFSAALLFLLILLFR